MAVKRRQTVREILNKSEEEVTYKTGTTGRGQKLDDAVRPSSTGRGIKKETDRKQKTTGRRRSRRKYWINCCIIFCSNCSFFFIFDYFFLCFNLSPAGDSNLDQRWLWDMIFLGSQSPYPKSGDFWDFFPRKSQMKNPGIFGIFSGEYFCNIQTLFVTIN